MRTTVLVILVLVALVSCTFLKDTGVGMKVAEYKRQFCENYTPEERTQIRKGIRSAGCTLAGDKHPAIVLFCAFAPEVQVVVMSVIDATKCPDQATVKGV